LLRRRARRRSSPPSTAPSPGLTRANGEGRNGIEVFKTSHVSIENLTVRNFDRATRDGSNGNEIWWNGGDGTGKIGAEGWHGAYLTAYDIGEGSEGPPRRLRPVRVELDQGLDGERRRLGLQRLG